MSENSRKKKDESQKWSWEAPKKPGNLTGSLKKLLGCNLMISVSAKMLYQVREKSEEMKIEKVYFFTPQFDARNRKDKTDSHLAELF